MKIVVIGDVHGKSCWKNILQNEIYDKVVFLGDYVSTHDKMSEDDQITTLNEILEFKEQNPDKVILLRGNHDIQHLGYEWAKCTGLSKKVQEYMISIIDRFLKNTQWIYIYNDIIFSHGGISQVWMDNSGFNSLDEINLCEPCERFGFIPDNPWDNYGDSVTQSCVWIRPQSLCRCNIKGYDQVIGHTPVTKIVDAYKSAKGKQHLWLCDCLPYQYLVIDDDNFVVKPVPGEKNKIRLINREADLWLEQCEDGSWKLKSNEDYITEFMTVGYGDDDKIISVDPSGGPFIIIGFELGDYIVSEIRDDLHLILKQK